MDFARQFAEWVDWTKQNLPQTGELPSISSQYSAFPAPWIGDWLEPFSDVIPEDIMQPVFSEMTAHSTDLATRFTSLHLYYHLPDVVDLCIGQRFAGDEDVSEVYEQDQYQVRKLTKQFKSDLGLLVRLLPVEQVSANWHVFRWEILNSYAIGDFDRALQLFDRAVSLKLEDSGNLLIMRGQFRYLEVFGPELDVPLTDIFWEPAVYPDGTELGATKAFCLFVSGLGSLGKPDAQLPDAQVSSLAHAAVDLEDGLRLHPEAEQVYRPMLARCLMLAGHREKVASEYDSALKSNLFGPAPRLKATIAEQFVKLGRADLAIELLAEITEQLPNEKGLNLRIAEILAREHRYEEVASFLVKEVDLDKDSALDWKFATIVAGADRSRSREAIRTEIDSHPEVFRPLEFVLRQYWPYFDLLCPDSRRRWLSATGHLAVLAPTSPTGNPNYAAQSVSSSRLSSARCTIDCFCRSSNT